ncbi:hypothetical protein C8R46DRAFT_277957 [Mycena filopes]|nr:hypothetical protein C8R46DRAFT_277957 [Mycena filopes]
MTTSSVLRHRLVELDDEMDALEAKLQRLSAERRQIVHDLDSLVYPVLTLPPEITSQIFMHYFEDPHIGRTRNPGRGPLTLASVCRSWRDLCLSLRVLWSALRIYPDRIPGGANDGFVNLLRCWLPRAGHLLLDLRVFRGSAGAIFALLTQYSTQWRTLGLTLDTMDYFPSLEVQGNVPSLQELIVNIIAQEGETPVLNTAFHIAPRLRKVELSRASLEWISLPWIQLTHLEFSGETISRLLEILQSTPNLEVLFISSLTHDWSDPHSGGIVTLASLHTLDLGYDWDGVVLDHLTVPNLKTLRLSALRTEAVLRFQHFLVRSAFPVRSICLDYMNTRTSNEVLQLLPAVEKVEIRYSQEWPDDAWDVFIDSLRKDREFLPALRFLRLHNCEVTSFPPHLLEMLGSRRNREHSVVAKLESFHVFFARRARNSDLVHTFRCQLRTLSDAGMEIIVD